MIAIRTAFICLVLNSCSEIGLIPDSEEKSAESNFQNNFPVYASYKDIPGVNAEEIDSIEELRRNGRSFVYGMSVSSECFIDRGRVNGFAALYCQWLSDLFDLPFTPAIYDWTDLLNGLENGSVDFTGELTATPERLKKYFMTSAIAERVLVITQLTGSQDPLALSLQRKPIFGFLAGTNTYSLVKPALPYEFDYVNVRSVEEANYLLREKKIDAFIDEGFGGSGVVENDLNTTETIPPVYNPVSMSTLKRDLAPIISVVQKYLDCGAQYFLVDLYNQSNKEYTTYRFHESLTEEEMDYVSARDGSRGEQKPIPFIMERDNYPWAFYNKIENTWQGIAWDVLKQIESFTGLRFEVVSDKDDTWTDNLIQLENGGGAFVTKLIRTNERKGKFLWTDTPYATDYYALLSKVETPDMGVSEVYNAKVGLLANSAYSEYFPRWFPNHPNTIIFQSREDALEALKNGGIDLYMGTRNTLLNLTNYLEEPGYKINQMFYHTADSYFGFNINEEILCSIINKAQLLVNTKLLESRWLSQTFDYRHKLIRQRQPYLIGLSVLMAIVILLMTTLVQKHQESKQSLQALVKRRTRELEMQKNTAQEAYKVKNRFLANMSHEFRTPLNAIIGLSQSEYERVSPESKEALLSINHSGNVLLGIINDLLDISSIEMGNMELKCADYSLPMLISNAANSTKLKIGGKKIDLQLEINENLPLMLYGDIKRIKQIIGNLLSNAVKFTKEGSILFRINFEKQEEEDNLTLIIEVCDTGVGIPGEHLQKLFSNYGQVDTDSNRSTGGAGMGLLISKKLAVLMNGDINVVSELGKGSIFTAWIPQKITDNTPLGKQTAKELETFTWKEAIGDKFYLPYARVLIVDDVPTNHAVIRGILRPYQLNIDAVLSGQESIDIIEKAEVHYDAIFMDHMMPDMDGIEAAKRIREIDTDYAKSVPIIALTANALPENEEMFLSSGFNAFMTKPININALNNVLNKWVRNREKEKLYSVVSEEEKPAQTKILSAFNIEGVDLTAGVLQFGGEENYLEIVKVFVNDTPKLLKEIQKFLDGFRIMPAAAAAALESYKNYTITIHGIKGSCYGICAVQVGDLAKELEIAAKNQNLTRVMELNNQFVSLTEKLVNELKILFPQKDESAKLEQKAPDPELLQKLLNAAQAFNIDKMFEAMDELDRFKYKEDNELVQQLRQATDNYEYLEVVKLINSALSSDEYELSSTGTSG